MASNILVRKLTLCAKYTLLHKYTAIKPPLKFNPLKSKTAELPMYAKLPK